MTTPNYLSIIQRIINRRQWGRFLFEILLIILIVIGIIFRFGWTNWSQGANLHPDEYGLTNTLTQLHMPASLGEYFNTRLSPISPYQKYDINGNSTDPGPDNRMRWGQLPIIIIRWLGEMSSNTGYNEIRLMGRSLSAFIDTLSLLFIFLIGQRLYNRTTGLLAAALSALAVMQIQQSHFMTSDNYAVLFTCMAMYCAVRIAQSPALHRPAVADNAQGTLVREYKPTRYGWVWYALFGVTFGMVMASRVNLLPLGGMVLIAAFISIAYLKLGSQQDLLRITAVVALYLVLSAVVAGLTFRVTQPMSFRASKGDTTLLTLTPNPDWVDSMKVAQSESNGIGGGPPSEQWAHRPAIIFPLVNMVVWGMGLPLGIMAWVGFIWAAWRLLRYGESWRSHLLPLVWVGGYFGFMGTRWVKSIRYFLPIYPFLCLLAAWVLLELWTHRDVLFRRRRGTTSADTAAGSSPPLSLAGIAGRICAGLVCTVVLLGTLIWAGAFVKAIYLTDHTRIQATQWILGNIPAPFQLTIDAPDGAYQQPVAAPDAQQILKAIPFIQPFKFTASGKLREVYIPHAAALSTDPILLHVQISLDAQGQNPLDEAVVQISPSQDGTGYRAEFQQVEIQQGITYYLIASVQDEGIVKISRTVVSNENWDEGLPVPMEGYDPFGQFYRGLTMEVRWYDDENKRQMFLENLAQMDYIILPSQRAIWSVPRIPLTYPMTMEYYRALFDGRLGFDLVAEFTSPFQIGPLYISDVGGTVAWNRKPDLPLFNNNLLAAEEAFSVYDHPPVWIFKKRADFNIETAKQILESIDLSKVVIQSPRDATIP